MFQHKCLPLILINPSIAFCISVTKCLRKTTILEGLAKKENERERILKKEKSRLYPQFVQQHHLKVSDLIHAKGPIPSPSTVNKMHILSTIDFKQSAFREPVVNVRK